MEIRHFYKTINIDENKLKIEYDKTSKIRPAWIHVKGLPEGIAFLTMAQNSETAKQVYKVYLTTKIPLFLPVNYTKEEIRIYYDKLSEMYDPFVAKRNIPASRFLLEQSEIKPPKKILELGAGSGLSALPFAAEGFDLTLVEHSAGMLAKAKARPELKECKFLKDDVRKLDLKEKFDMVFSVYSFALNSYFDLDEMDNLFKIVANHLKKDGILALLGYDFEPSKLFKKIKSGLYDIGDKCFHKWIVCKKIN